jgi:hypothetical protein
MARSDELYLTRKKNGGLVQNQMMPAPVDGRPVTGAPTMPTGVGVQSAQLPDMGIQPPIVPPAPPAPHPDMGIDPVEPVPSTPDVPSPRQPPYPPTLPPAQPEPPPPVVTAESMAFDPTQQTVEGRLDNMLDEDSVYLQDARTRADQQSNARGLLNSSMAVGAGELAAIQAATPIAAQDAGFVNSKAASDQAAINRASEVTAGFQSQSQLQDKQGKQAMQLERLSGQQEKQLAKIEAEYKMMMQSSDSAARFFSQTSQDIGAILNNENLSVEAKQELINLQVDLLENGLAVLGGISDLDLTGLLDFTEFSLPTTPEPVPTAPDPNTDPSTG